MLIITEKSSVPRQFTDALEAIATVPFTFKNEKEKITIIHCRGHLLEAREADRYDEKYKRWDIKLLPVIPEYFRYSVIKESEKILTTASKLISLAVRDKKETKIEEIKFEKRIIGKCHICKKNIYEGKKNYYCDRYKEQSKCNFNLWKETKGKKFSENKRSDKRERIKSFV